MPMVKPVQLTQRRNGRKTDAKQRPRVLRFRNSRREAVQCHGRSYTWWTRVRRLVRGELIKF